MDRFTFLGDAPLPAQIQIQKRQSKELKLICGLGVGPMAQVVAAIQKTDDCPLTPQDIQRTVFSVLADEDVSEVCARQFLSLAGLKRQLRLKSIEVIEGLDFGIKNDPLPWSVAQLEQWESAKPHLQSLLESSNLLMASKAVDLAYDYANLLQSARLVTDIRPVFDESAASIEGAVVSFTLRLVIEGAEGRRSMSVALDRGDVESLIEQCQRALVKATTAQRVMSETGEPVRTVISGGGPK